ncbi:MAG: lysophospholipase [Candidatus Limnocylindrales bacterium]
MSSTTDSATTRDGVRLLTRHWPAGVPDTDAPQPRHWPAEAPRAAVVIVHGLGEHSGRYEVVGSQLAAAGLETFSWDLRGFGASGGERAYVDTFARYYDDLADRLAAARAALPGRPVVLYGHSLGGLITLGYCLSDRTPPDLMVLSAPGIADSLAAWKHVAAPILARIVPKLHIANGIGPKMLSRDEGIQQAVQADPLVQTSTTAWLGALGFAEQARVRAAASRLSVPTLVIHAEDDELVPVQASEALATIPGVTRRTYPGIRHELHNEPEGPSIVAGVIAWIEWQLSGAHGD